MRTVFENRQVAHIWIQRGQSQGRSNNGNFYFRDSTIYSYGSHFPIARILPQSIDSKAIVLVTEDRYSHSTNRHQGYVDGALRGRSDIVIFHVPSLRQIESNGGKLDTKTLDSMRRIFIGRVANAESNVASYTEAVKPDWTPPYEGARNYDAEYLAESITDLAQARESYRLFQRAFKYRRKLPSDCAAYIAAEKAAEKKEVFDERVSDARKRAKQVPQVLKNAEILANLPPFGTVESYDIDFKIRMIESTVAQLNQARYWLARGKAGTAPKRDVKNALSVLSPLLAKWKQYAIDNSRESRRLELLSTAASIVAYVDGGERHDSAERSEVGNLLPRESNWQLVNSRDVDSGSIPTLLKNLATIKSEVPEYERVVVWLTRQASIALALDAIVIGRAPYREKIRETNEARVARWIAGESVPGFNQVSPTLVRKHGDTLQTSRGASAPFAQAVSIYRAASLCRARGKSWHRNGEHMRVGSFELDAIDTGGNVEIGCHRITMEEMERLAVKEIPQLVEARFPLPVVQS